jgi:hypothetical protein
MRRIHMTIFINKERCDILLRPFLKRHFINNDLKKDILSKQVCLFIDKTL